MTDRATNPEPGTTHLAKWLEERIVALPTPDREAVITDVLARVATTPQRRHRWQVGRGTRKASRSPGLALAAGVAIVALASGLVLFSVGHGPTPSPSPSPTPEPASPSPTPFAGRELVVVQDGSADATTIGEAVELARDGDRVLVRPGTYRESIEVRKDIEIRGDGPREAIVVELTEGSPTLNGIGPSLAPFAFFIEDSSAVVSDLTVRGPQLAVAFALNGGAPRLERLVVDLAGDRDEGLERHIESPHGFAYLFNDSGAVIRDSVADGLLWVVGVDVGVGVGQAEVGTGAALIEGNRLDEAILISAGNEATIVRDNSAWSISIEGDASPLVEGNEITGSARTGAGITIGGPGGSVAPFGAAPMVRGNSVQGSEIGIRVYDRASPTLEGNVVSGSSIGVSISSADPLLRGNVIRDGGTGVSIAGPARPTLVENEVIGNATGVSISSADPVLEGNTIRGNDGPGILIVDGSPSLEGNVIDSNGLGIDLRMGATPILHDNSVCDNGVNVRVVDTAAPTQAGGGICADPPSSSPHASPDVSVADLVTDAVALSVERVLSDGAGHDIDVEWVRDISIAPDGTVWMTVGEATWRLWKLGKPGDHDDGGLAPGDLVAGPHGTLWIPTRTIRYFDGESWSRHSPVDASLLGLEVLPDGTARTAWVSDGGISVGRYDGTGWIIDPMNVPLPSARCCPSWGERTVALAGNDVWLGGGGGLWRLDGNEWESVRPLPATGSDFAITQLDVGADGAVWAFVSDGVDDWELMRFDGDDATSYTNADGVPMVGKPGAWAGRMAAGPDGRVWLTPPDHGVLSFDGTTWTRYLEGVSLGQQIDLEVAPDGTVWVKGHDVYVIHPSSPPAKPRDASLAELVTDPVEPSVERVLADGAGHDVDGSPVWGTAIAPNGTVWMSVNDDSVDPSLWKLGAPGAHDGSSLYAVASVDAWWEPGSKGLDSFDGTSLTTHTPIDGTALAATVAADGTVWGAWITGSSIRVASWDGDGWTVHPAELPISSPDICCPFHGDFIVTPNGELWLSISVDGYGERDSGGLWRLDGDRWERVQPLGVEAETRVAVGADGTLWVHLEDHVGECPTNDPCWGSYLARLDGGDWTVFSVGDGVPRLGGQAFVSRMAVGPDGKVWLTPGGGGVRSFDGTSWTRFLEGVSLGQKIDLDVAPDGTVWVKGPPVYIIRP